MRATIVFADGSKRDAHNLDFTRERHELRREMDSYAVVDTFQAGMTIPQPDTSASTSVLIQLQQTLASQRELLASTRKRITNEERSVSRTKAINALDATLIEVNAALRVANIELTNRRNSTTRRDNLDYILYLQDLLMDNGIGFKPRHVSIRQLQQERDGSEAS